MNKKFLLAFCLTSFLACSFLPADQTSASPGHLDLGKVYQGSPWIYISLGALSVFSLAIWLYSLWTWRLNELLPPNFKARLHVLLNDQDYEAILQMCRQDSHFSAQIVAAGIAARKHGPQMVREAMTSEGKRCAQKLWQRISFLNEVAFVAPMLGLLGTVLGLFFAFYDTQRTSESLTAVFDGLGIAIGTTVAGLVVAILAMTFASILKFRAVSLLNNLENEVLPVVNQIEYSSNVSQ